MIGGRQNQLPDYYMRLRNVPGSREYIEDCIYAVNEPELLRGKWRELFGKPADSKLHIEIGTGKGRFIHDLAAANPDISFVGIEKFSSVLIRALEKAAVLEPANLKFIRFDAENINNIFAEDEVDRIYLNFSDPWPKDRHAKRRLTSVQFLNRYDNLLAKDGQIIFKTDNRMLFDFSLEQAEQAGWKLIDKTYDLHSSHLNEGNIMTEYEERFSSQGVPICEMIIER